MVHLLPGFGKLLRLALAAGIFMALAGTTAFAITPVCNGHNVYPCSVGGTLLVNSSPTSFTSSGGSGVISFGGGNAVFTNDPQNPGITAFGFGNLVAMGPLLPSASGTFSLATVSGLPSITGANASITCGVTGAATFSLTLTTPGGPLVVSCPTVATAGLTSTVNGQISFPAVSSLAMTLTVAGTATSSTDTLTLAAFSAQVNIPSNGCNTSVSPGGQAFSPTGGTGSINITTGPACPWGVFNIPSWVVLTSAASGTGNGSVSYQVLPNPGADQSGTLMVTNVSFTVEQEGTIAGLNFVGSMPHLAGEENWTTAFTLVNKSAAPNQARVSFFGDTADPTGNGPLTLPLAFPQLPNAASPVLSPSLDRTLGSNASLILTTAGPQTGQVLVGSAQLAATGAVDGFAIFHQTVTTQEAVVPLETRNASSYLLAFDNTNSLVLGVALDNISAQNAVIPVVIRNEGGAVISAPGTNISLGGHGHTSFVLSDPALGFPITGNIRGTIEFDTPAGGQISVLGLRFTPPNNALTTIPALANVGTGGGSIAHLASGGDGWQTTFVLVNVGASSAQATLSFFGDATGAPLALPLTFPQGNIADMTAPSVTQTLAAGATLVIVSSGAPQLLTGSAQLSTTGHVSGFVIYRHNNQEAVVPLESRNAVAYIIAFDNTNGTFTGVAVNAVSAQVVNIPVIVRDDAGTQLATDTISLAANGHIQFTLVTDKYPATLNKRGTIEFDAPGVPIGAVGIRIPAGGAHTYTTLPSLVK